MLIIMISMNMMFSIIFMFMKHPMSMGLILLIQSIIISLMMNMFSYTSWFSYILFLIMVGGMLILFMYMTSLASNEKFKFSTKIFISSIMITLLLMMIMNLNDQMLMNMTTKMSNSMEIFNNMNFYKNENSNSLNMLYNKPNWMMTIMMINYLLITLIAVVKITKFNYGPLRQMF